MAEEICEMAEDHVQQYNICQIGTLLRDSDNARSAIVICE